MDFAQNRIIQQSHETGDYFLLPVDSVAFMKITKDMVKMLNSQISLEAVASQNYLSTAAWCELSGFDGGAAYFYAQSDEERDHMLKIVKFLTSIGVSPVIPAVKEAKVRPKDLEDALKIALASEQTVTAAIHDMLKQAHKGGDYTVLDILLWFANEQVQEETKFEALLQKFDTIGRDPLAVAEIDKIMASQTGA